MESLAFETMSKDLIIAHQDQSLDEAHRMMATNNIRHLPVVSSEKILVGIISDRDLQRAMTSEVSGDGRYRTESCHFDPRLKVKDYMSWPVKCVNKNTPLKIVAQLMINEKVSALLVKDHVQIAGIITTEDLLKYLVKSIEEPKTAPLNEFFEEDSSFATHAAIA